MAHLLRLVSHLPLWVLHGLADLLFVVVFYALRYRRRVAEDNLRRCFPDWTASRRRRVLRQSYRRLAEVAMEALKGRTLDPKQLSQRVTLANPEVLQTHFDAGRSVLLLLGHQSNWEWLILAASQHFEAQMDAVYKPLSVTAIDEVALETRTRFGAHLVPMEQTLVELMRRKPIVKAFAMLADQVPLRKEDKRWRTFLGRDTAFFLGAEKIARMTKYPAVFVHVRRERRGYYRVEFEPLAEPPYARDDHALTDAFAEAVERQILAQPEGWLWTHRRWKYEKPFYD